MSQTVTSSITAPRRRQQQLRAMVAALGAVVGLILGPKAALSGPAFVGGVLEFTMDNLKANEDRANGRWLRSPLVVDGWLLFRSLAIGGPSSVYLVNLAPLLDGTFSTDEAWPQPVPAVLPTWADVLAQGQALAPPRIVQVRALYRGPAFLALDADGKSEQLFVATPDGTQWNEMSPSPKGPVVDVVRAGDALAVATRTQVLVAKTPWFTCQTDQGCAALQPLGIGWAQGAGDQLPRLAVAYGDPQGKDWVCVITAPNQRCVDGNRVAGMEPLLSANGQFLAIPVERRDKWGLREAWDIRLYRVESPQGQSPPKLSLAGTIPDVVLVGAEGQGGDYVIAKGSFGWLGETLVYLSRAGGRHEVGRYRCVASSCGSEDAVSLPASLALPRPRKCERSAKTWLQPGARLETLPPVYRDLLWLPAAERVSGCDGKTETVTATLGALFAVQPFQHRGKDYVAVHAMLSFGDDTSGKATPPVSRILVFTLE